MSKVVIVRKSPTVRPRRVSKIKGHPLHVPVNVKVTGERTMLKQVRLEPLGDSRDVVKVLTGTRGRPRLLPVSEIERVRVL